MPTARGRVTLRFEDITEDGRLLLEVLPNALDATVWKGQLESDPLGRECFRRGILPILSRFVLEGTAGPFSTMKPLDAEGGFELAVVREGGRDDGPVERTILNMYGELRGPIGRTRPPKPQNAGSPALAGRVFAEHVFTKPFAKPEERRVTTLDEVPGAPRDLRTYSPRPLASVLDLPEDARPLDELAPEGEVLFGVMHTDSNHHVNSLVYLRLFEEAALRRFASHGRREPVLSRKLEIAYRKPCFAGDLARVMLRSFEWRGALGVVGQLVSERGGAAATHCAVRALFG